MFKRVDLSVCRGNAERKTDETLIKPSATHLKTHLITADVHKPPKGQSSHQSTAADVVEACHLKASEMSLMQKDGKSCLLYTSDAADE